MTVASANMIPPLLFSTPPEVGNTFRYRLAMPNHRNLTSPPSLWLGCELQKYHCPYSASTPPPVAIRYLLQRIATLLLSIMANCRMLGWIVRSWILYIQLYCFWAVCPSASIIIWILPFPYLHSSCQFPIQNLTIRTFPIIHFQKPAT